MITSVTNCVSTKKKQHPSVTVVRERVRDYFAVNGRNSRCSITVNLKATESRNETITLVHLSSACSYVNSCKGRICVYFDES